MVCLSLSASQIAPIPYVVHLFWPWNARQQATSVLVFDWKRVTPSFPGSLQVAINEMDIPVVMDVRRIKEV
jgi:hypothetical protein